MKKQLIILVLLIAVLLAPAIWHGVSSIASSAYSQLAASSALNVQVGPTSQDPYKDILEVARAFAVLYKVDSCSLAKSMGAVFGNECGGKQNCYRSGSKYYGSYQMGIPFASEAEAQLGGDLARMGTLVEQGEINRVSYTHMLAAAQQGRAAGIDSGRMHHMYATLLATAKHVQMESALQGRSGNQLERSAAHVAFQFTPPTVLGAIRSGVDKRPQWYGNCGIDGLSVFEAITRIAGGGSSCSSRAVEGMNNVNCNLEVGYDGPSGFGTVGTVGSNTGWQNSPLGKFFGGQSGLGGGSNPYSNTAYGTSGTSDNSGTSMSTNDEYVNPDDNSEFVGNSSPTGTVTSDTNISSSVVSSDSPILTCLPNVVVADEPALILWQCRDGSSASSGGNFSTGGKVMGKTRVNPSADTKYELFCGDVPEPQVRCSVEVINPAIAIITDTSTVPMWEKVNISWNSLDTQSCRLDSDDNNSKYADWNRSGTSGDVYSHPITKETKFTLTCTTKTGMEKSKSITVDVE